MSQRTAGLIGAMTLLAVLIAVQFLRLATQPNRSMAVLEGVLLLGLTVVGVSLALFGQEIISTRRWRRALNFAPSGEHMLIAVGDYRDSSSRSPTGVLRVGLFLGSKDLALVALNGAAVGHPIRVVDLSDLQATTVQQLDSPTAWATILDIMIKNESDVSITLDGWRLRRRRRLYEIASAAAEAIGARLLGRD